MGDLAKFDAEGNLYVVDRKKDVIIRGGQNISPTEIETLLVTHPKVVNAAVVPMPDPVMGEKACAYVILKEDAIFEFDEMISFLKEKKIAPYKLPERLEVLDRFPMAGDGTKVVKKELAQDIARKLEAEPKG
jgi:non-ribosomal peptide synthetase component E (peptide arylation enzyme)